MIKPLSLRSEMRNEEKEVTVHTPGIGKMGRPHLALTWSAV